MAIAAPNPLATVVPPAMSGTERREANILVLDPDPSVRAGLRQTLTSLEFGAISEASDGVQALAKLQERHFTHVIFDAKKGVSSPTEFLTKALEMDDLLIALPSSMDPTVDDVFDLLCLGARGYLVKPFNINSVEEALIMATKGEPLSEAILYAKNRNEALASLIFSSLDKLTTVMRQARQFETAAREVPRAEAILRRGVDLGRTFAKGGEDELLAQMVEFCIERASGPATKLGRFRKRLEQRKEHLAKRKASRRSVDDSPPQ